VQLHFDVTQDRSTIADEPNGRLVNRLEAKFSSKRTTGKEVWKSSNPFGLDQKTRRSLE
jgi:hypothetical protein